MRRASRFAIPCFLAVAAACGGGGGGPYGLTGTWLLTPAQDGIPGDPVHLTLAQSGEAVTGIATCNSEILPGSGTFTEGRFVFRFLFAGGGELDLSGVGTTESIVGTFSTPESVGTFTMDRTAVVLDCANACDPVVVTPFVSTDFTDLSLVEEISLFRSSAGHDYSDGCEDCRSMKHYFAPYVANRVNNLVPVRAPVDGTIVSIRDEGHGASPPGLNKQVHLRSTLYPDTTFVFFHVDLSANAVLGNSLLAGDAIGTARLYYDDLMETAHDFDVAVRVHTLYGDRYVSWFEVVTDALFATYVARGAAMRSDFLLSKTERDGDPLTCTDQTFTSTGSLPAWFVLDPP